MGREYVKKNKKLIKRNKMKIFITGAVATTIIGLIITGLWENISGFVDDKLNTELVYSVEEINLENIEGERDKGYDIRGKTNGKDIIIYAPHFKIDINKEKGKIGGKNYIFINSLFSDEYKLENYKVSLDENNRIYININFNLDANDFADPVPLYVCLEDKKTKKYNISLILLDTKQLPCYTTFRSVPSDTEGMYHVEIFANNPKIELAPLNFREYSIDEISELSLDDTKTDDKFVYNNREIYKNEFKKIKRELDSINN